MKKLITLSFVLALASVAQAATEYEVYTETYVAAHSKDTDPGVSHKGWYSSYVMTQADAQKAMGTTETVTYKTMAAWLANNFADNKASVIANAEMISYKDYVGDYNQYHFYKDGDDGSDLDSAIGVFFYDDGTTVDFNVMSNTGTKEFFFDDRESYSSGWMVVPEPTSGLLLLLGMAGLALKRKRT